MPQVGKKTEVLWYEFGSSARSLALLHANKKGVD